MNSVERMPHTCMNLLKLPTRSGFHDLFLKHPFTCSTIKKNKTEIGPLQIKLKSSKRLNIKYGYLSIFYGDQFIHVWGILSTEFITLLFL
jgi:hypothetical protein